MFKQIVWLAGTIGLGYLAYRFAAWKLLAQMALLFALFVWVIVGGIAVSRRTPKPGDALQAAKQEAMMRNAVAFRQAMVQRHGEAWVSHIEAESGSLTEMMRGPQGASK